MSAAKIIKQLMLETDISVKELAGRLGISPQVLSNKLYRDSFSYSDYLKVAQALDCTVQTVVSKNGKTFQND